MATEQNLTTLTRIAGADLSTKQYRFVEQGTTGTVTVCNADGERALGVLQNDPLSGQAATIAYAGVSRVVAGDVVAIGGEVMTDDEGRAIAATSTNVALGEALSAATAAGQIISVLLRTRSL